MVALYEGRTDDGFRYHQEMLRLARLQHAPYEAGMALLGLAQSRTYGGDAPAGLTFAEEQYRVAQQLRNPSMLALALYDQAEPLSLTEPETARDRYERAIGLAQAAGSSFIEGIALVGLASLLGRSGRPSTALPQFLAIIDRWYDMGIWHHQWTTLRNLVQLLLRIGCNEDAAVLIQAIEASKPPQPPSGPTPNGWPTPPAPFKRHSINAGGPPPSLEAQRCPTTTPWPSRATRSTGPSTRPAMINRATAYPSGRNRPAGPDTSCDAEPCRSRWFEPVRPARRGRHGRRPDDVTSMNAQGRLSERGSEEDAEAIGDRRRAGPDRELPDGSSERGSAGQHADGGAGEHQGEPDQHGRGDQRGDALQAEQERQDRDRGAGGEEGEAGQCGADPGAHDLVPVAVGRDRGRPSGRGRCCAARRRRGAGPRRRARHGPGRPARARWHRGRGAGSTVWASEMSGAEAASSSRCERTETYSPAPIDSAPASSPASPVSRTVVVDAPPPVTPSTRARLLTRPSLAPNTAARNVPETRARPRAARPRTTSSWIRSSAAMAGVASASVWYGDRVSARCASARTNTDPNRRASNASRRIRGAPRRAGPTSSPSRSAQCAACRSSASANPSRISRSSPERRLARSRYTFASSRSSASRRRHRRTDDDRRPDRSRRRWGSSPDASGDTLATPLLFPPDRAGRMASVGKSGVGRQGPHASRFGSGCRRSGLLGISQVAHEGQRTGDDTAQAKLAGAGGPGLPALGGEHAFGDSDLLGTAGLVWHTGAAEGTPG